MYTGPDDLSSAFIISFDCKSKAMQVLENKVVSLTKDIIKIIKSILKESVRSLKPAECNPLFFYPIQEKYSLDFAGLQIISNYLELILILLIRNSISPVFTFPQNSTCLEIVKKVITFMEQNLYGDLDVQTICKNINYGKTYLSSIFKKFTGESMMQYYLKMKINEAKKLIRDTNYNYTEIANMLHFCNPHYFTTTFKRFQGMTPSEYSKIVRKK